MLASAGWTCTLHGDGTARASSPDRLLTAHRRPFDPGYCDSFVWEFSAAGRPGDSEKVWDARIYESAPAHVLAGFARALVSSEPVQRRRADPLGHPSAVRAPGRLSSMDVIGAHHARLTAAWSSCNPPAPLGHRTAPAPARPAAEPRHGADDPNNRRK
ncbi:DUF317 domain-containing protein [Streptomyces sp. NBC_00690]|uniref:DUF317 domain-containing protein n=1 Tax=Streptomyces sp. NBC_00690 TaxID=2975808 RepID=UPI002E2876D9|nr:DUF317 domain-containing protein [Streptomyces sp. NBC_00690]